MLRIFQTLITLGFISGTLGEYGDIRILGDSKSSELLFEDHSDNWNAVCAKGFDDNAGDVACRQLGYERSTDVFIYADYYYHDDVAVCYTQCDGNEDRLTDCVIHLCDDEYYYCGDHDGVIGITCTNSPALELSTLQIVGIAAGGVVLVALIICTVCCICCLAPCCPCYYKRSRATRTEALQGVATATSSTRTTSYRPLPTSDPDIGYQPYPTALPTATTGKY